MSRNILLDVWDSPLESVPFSQIQQDDFLPAIEQAIEQAKQNIQQIKQLDLSQANFVNTIERLESCSDLLDRASLVFFNLHSAQSDEQMQAIAQKVSPLLSQFSSDLLLDEQLFAFVKAVYEQKDHQDLNQEQLRLLDKTYRGFVRNGALLEQAQKEQLRTIDEQLSKLTLQFSDKLLAQTNAFELKITNPDDLQGLPEAAIEVAKQEAQARSYDQSWVFTLQYPSYIPFMKYSQKQNLREIMYKAFSSRAFHGDEFDNQQTVLDIVRLRKQRASLLGYESHAQFVLEERMAQSPDQVRAFLNDLLKVAKPLAEKEFAALKDFAKVDELKRWDLAYYSEKLKKSLFDFDDEQLKVYFALPHVLSGLFEVARRLYGLEFKLRSDIDAYDPDVQVYEVKEDGQYLGLLYMDLFPRPGKRQGAWMTNYREQSQGNGQDIRPHVSIVANLTRPTEQAPSLLNLQEVLTIFHEFGHSLHSLLSRCEYSSMAGTNVLWDFVELPSQIMENWLYERECLDLVAKHYQTGEPMPEALLVKIRESRSFQEAMATMRQLSFAFLDLSWHDQGAADIASVSELEHKVLPELELLPAVSETSISCSFSHIFHGGYSAGYYSYKWAELLDADAFESFLEQGLFDAQCAKRFKQCILSKGNSDQPMELYVQFKGRKPSADALMRRMQA